MQDLDQVLATASPALRGLQGASLLVTGGTGFVGRWLLETFGHANEVLGLEASLTLLTRDQAAFRERAPHLHGKPWLHIEEGDLIKAPSLRGPFTHIVHAAAAGSSVAAPGTAILDAALAGAQFVVDLARKSDAEAVLFTSSGAVYGHQADDVERIPETSLGAPPPLDVASAYAEGKRMTEAMLACAAQEGGFGAKVARCFAFVGPHLSLDGRYAAGNFLRDALLGGPIRIAGHPASTRSYLYASDLATWLWTILARGRSGEAYNVGSEKPVSIRDLAQTIARQLHVAVEEAPPAAWGPPTRYVPSTGKAQGELALRETVSLPEAISRTVAWLQRQPAPVPQPALRPRPQVNQ